MCKILDAIKESFATISKFFTPIVPLGFIVKDLEYNLIIIGAFIVVVEASGFHWPVNHCNNVPDQVVLHVCIEAQRQQTNSSHLPESFGLIFQFSFYQSPFGSKTARSVVCLLF